MQLQYFFLQLNFLRFFHRKTEKMMQQIASMVHCLCMTKQMMPKKIKLPTSIISHAVSAVINSLPSKTFRATKSTIFCRNSHRRKKLKTNSPPSTGVLSFRRAVIAYLKAISASLKLLSNRPPVDKKKTRVMRCQTIIN